MTATLYDAAGERFYNTDRTQELRYLNKARTFILVIDPLSVESFWQQLPAATQQQLGSVRSAAPSPDLAYQQTHQQIELHAGLAIDAGGADHQRGFIQIPRPRGFSFFERRSPR